MSSYSAFVAQVLSIAKTSASLGLGKGGPKGLGPTGNALKAPKPAGGIQGPKPAGLQKNFSPSPGPGSKSLAFGGGKSNMYGGVRAAGNARTGATSGVSPAGISNLGGSRRGWPKMSAAGGARASFTAGIGRGVQQVSKGALRATTYPLRAVGKLPWYVKGMGAAYGLPLAAKAVQGKIQPGLNTLRATVRSEMDTRPVRREMLRRTYDARSMPVM